MSHLALPGMRISRTQSSLCHLAPGDFPGLGVDGEAEQGPYLDRRQRDPRFPGSLRPGGGSHTHSVQIKPHHPITQKPSKRHKREFRQRPEGGRGIFSKPHFFGNACAFWQVSGGWMRACWLCMCSPHSGLHPPHARARASRPPAGEGSTLRNTGQINLVMSPRVSITDRMDQGDWTWQ